ncbi:transmembrane protein 163-like isoform X2 [Anneissia japonica]|nr:transmembrane protein 163-like isoform X2 [Anneissia japonica]
MKLEEMDSQRLRLQNSFSLNGRYDACSSLHQENSDFPQSRDFLKNDDIENNLKQKERKKWNRLVVGMSFGSMAFIGTVAVLSFHMSAKYHSAAALGLGCDCLLDMATSGVIIWRFSGSTENSVRRERITLIFFGILFILSGIFIIFRATVTLFQQKHIFPSSMLCILVFSSGVVCSILIFIKLFLAKKLNSKCLEIDALGSVANVVLSFSILISTVIIEQNENIWFIDAIVASFIGLLLWIYGAKLWYDVVRDRAELPTDL